MSIFKCFDKCIFISLVALRILCILLKFFLPQYWRLKPGMKMVHARSITELQVHLCWAHVWALLSEVTHKRYQIAEGLGITVVWKLILSWRSLEQAVSLPCWFLFSSVLSSEGLMSPLSAPPFMEDPLIYGFTFWSSDQWYSTEL